MLAWTPCALLAAQFDVAALEAIAGDGWFRPYFGNPLLVRGGSGAWDDWALGSASVVEANGLYHMYYEGWGDDSIQIGHATSPDGVNWSKDSANPALGLAPSGWDSAGTWDPFVLYEDGVFKMWYGGSPLGAGDFQWGYATSTDGSTFNRVGKISNIPNGQVEDDHVVRNQATGDYEMYYWDRNLEPYGLLRATSPDETSFDFANAQPVTIDGVAYPKMYKFTQVFQENGIWNMFYGEFVRPRCNDCRIGYATSNDGLNWTTQNTNVLVGQDGEVMKVADDLYLMYYGPDGYFDGENGDIRLAVMKGSLSDLAATAPQNPPVTTGPRVWDAGAGNGLWSTSGNWQDNGMNGPGGVVPSNSNVYFNYGSARVNTIVPAVKDVFVANNVAPPSNPNQPSINTLLSVEQGDWLRISGGQLRVGAFTGASSPASGVTATIDVSGNGTINSQFGVITNPFYHPTIGNISSTINISDNGQLDAGTGLFFGGGTTTINLSDNAAFLAADGLFEQLSSGGSAIFNPNNVANQFGVNAVIHLADNARFIVSNTGPFAISESLANLYISAGVFQAANGVIHFVSGHERVFMATPLPGDYNGNGIVDAADYTVWRNTLGSTTDLRANGDKAGASANKIDLADYVFWKSQFAGSGNGGLSGREVPEPSTFWLTAIVLTAACLGRNATFHSPKTGLFFKLTKRDRHA